MGATLVPLPAGEFFYQLQQGKVDGGEMSTPAMDAALGFDKLGLPYYMPGWQQPSAVIDFLMRKDKWEALPAASAPDRDRLPRQHRLDAEPLAAHPGAGAGEARGVGRRHQAMVARDPATPSARTPRSCSRNAPSATPISPPRWANQKKFMAQSVDWRTMSRLP